MQIVLDVGYEMMTNTASKINLLLLNPPLNNHNNRLRQQSTRYSERIKALTLHSVIFFFMPLGGKHNTIGPVITN